MYLNPEKKKEIFGTYGKSNTDTGSPEAQIALFSYRIAHLTEHLKVNKDRALEGQQEGSYDSAFVEDARW